MVLAINIGNTHITIGAHEKGEWVFTGRLRTAPLCSVDEYAIKISELFRLYGKDTALVSSCVLGSVAPAITANFTGALKMLFPVRLYTVGPGLKSGLKIGIDDPAELGADLLCSAVAALNLEAPPLAILCCDTAITLMAVNRDRKLLGGVILPGPQLSMSALLQNAAKLSEIEHRDEPQSVLATSTAACLQAGSVLGTAAMLDGLLARMEEELCEKPKVIATGFFPKAVLHACKTPIRYEETLILDGLYEIFTRNQPRK